MTGLGLSARLKSLADAIGVDVDTSQVDRLELYLLALARWNERVSLTSLPLNGFPEATLERLIGEPLRALSIIPASIGRWFDLGSGGGSPAIPLKILRPGLRLWMVESRSRKASFLREAVRRVGLDGTSVLCSRIEAVAEAQLPQADIVTVRAVKITSEIEGAIGSLLAPGGRLVLFSRVASGSRFPGMTSVDLPSGVGLVVLDRPPLQVLPSVPRGTISPSTS